MQNSSNFAVRQILPVCIAMYVINLHVRSVRLISTDTRDTRFFSGNFGCMTLPLTMDRKHPKNIADPPFKNMHLRQVHIFMHLAPIMLSGLKKCIGEFYGAKN
jgi:hypothetical protein